MALFMKFTVQKAEDINKEVEKIMDLVGKAMVGNQVSKLSKGLGLDEDEDKEDKFFSYDPKKEQEEEDRRLQEKAKRDESHAKRKAERAVKRNEIREKYGLKESKTDKALIDNKGKTQPIAKPEEEEDRENSLTRQEKMASPSKEKEKCRVM